METPRKMLFEEACVGLNTGLNNNTVVRVCSHESIAPKMFSFSPLLSYSNGFSGNKNR